jgi:alpha-tubulin suppressor-like RCC1 family protein
MRAFGTPGKAGFYHVCAIKVGGTVTCWGGNDVGQLGNGTIGDNLGEPVDRRIVARDRDA